MNIEHEPPAREEVSEAVRYYAAISSELADDLIDEFEAALQRVLQFPHGWPAVDRGRGTRRCFLSRFPYQIIYRVEGDLIRVYAFAHQRRKPGYWRGRVGARRDNKTS